MVFQTKSIIIFLIAAIGLFSALSYFGVLKTQSIITPPIQAQISDGRVVWIATIASDSIKDGVGLSINPADFTMDNSADGYPAGTKVIPKDDTIVYISKNNNACEYVVEQSSFNYALGFPQVQYYTLRNPSRKIMMDVCVASDCHQIDAVNFAEAPTTFANNGGELTVKGLGALVGQKNCPEYSDVAILFGSNNVPKYISKSRMFSRTPYNIYLVPDASMIVALFSQPKMNDWVINHFPVNPFIEDFSSAPTINSVRNLLTGQMPDQSLGVGTVTVVADAKYFRSAYIVPSQQARPRIDSITINDLKQSSSGTATVKITNSGDKGNVAVSATASRSQIIPESQSITLDRSKTLSFQVIAPANTGADKITVKVCTTDQLGNNICDSKSESFNVLSDNPREFCGDNKCQSDNGETQTTCPEDCKGPGPGPVPPGTPLDCSKYNQLGGLIWSNPETTEGKGFLGLFPYEKNTCVPNYTGLIAVIIVIVIAGLIVYFKKTK